MSSACVCHTKEWCFYCEMYVPLERKLELAVKALEWYADENTYLYPEDEELITINALSYLDYGKLARESLEQIGKVNA